MGKLSRTPVHKMIRSDRPNGKAYKKRPKGFDADKGKLYTVSGTAWKGLTVHLSED